MNDDFKFLIESYEEKQDRIHRRNFILIVMLITYSFLMTALFVGSNYYWIQYEKSFEDVVETVTIESMQDGEGVNIVGGGNVSYGTENQDNKDN